MSLPIADLIAYPAVGLAMSVIGLWARREIKMQDRRTAALELAMQKKTDLAYCDVNNKRIHDRLNQGDDEFDQIIKAIDRFETGLLALKDLISTQQLQQQESTRVLGECLMVMCQDLGGNGSCERVKHMLDQWSDQRLGGGEQGKTPS